MSRQEQINPVGVEIEATPDEWNALESLVDGSSGDPELEARFVGALILCVRVWKERQKKYGRANIARTGAPGVLVRIADKQARLEQAYKGKGFDSPDESVQDTWIDQANYGAIGLMCHKGWWPEARR